MVKIIPACAARRLLAGWLIAFGTAATAQYPDRPVQAIVNYGAGGVTDVVSRVIFKAMEAQLGQSIIVQNRAGAQGTLGPAFLAEQAPNDGYTIGIVTFASLAIIPHTMSVPYGVDDFDFLGGFGRFRYGLAVRNDAPYTSVQDLVAAARAADRPLFFGTAGAPNNLAFYRLAAVTGAQFEPVLYKSGVDAVVGLAAGQTVAVIQSPSELMPAVESGRLRLLASVSPARWDDQPHMPTLMEEGFDVKIESWVGLAVPSGTPTPVRQKLEQALAFAVNDAQTQKRLRELGLDPIFMEPRDYARMMREGYEQMGPLLREAGMPTLP